MVNCAYCGAETSLYQSGTAICVKCAEAREARQQPSPRQELPLSQEQVRRILLRHIAETTARADAASAEFNVIMSAIPTGIPNPDGAQKIHQASRDLAAARKEMMRAHSRLNDFLTSGVIPEDVQRTGSDGS